MKFRLLLLPAIASLAACSSISDVAAVLTPYRIDVRQGNFVSQEMVAQLKPGLAREQVRFILGSPLVVDVFHADRWDYVYRFRPGRGEVQERRLTVFFENNLLSRVAGDVVADVAADAASSKSGAEGTGARAPLQVIEIKNAGDDKGAQEK